MKKKLRPLLILALLMFFKQGIAQYTTSICGELNPVYTNSQTPSQFIGPVTPAGLFEAVRDRFGNTYSFNEIAINNSVAGYRPINGVASCTAGYFVVHFALGSGMEVIGDPNHDARRNTICEVLSNLSGMINPALVIAAPTNSAYVNILIDNIYNYVGNPQNTGVLGLASSYHTFPIAPTNTNPGISDNQIYKTIISQQNAYYNVAYPLNVLNNPGFYHGYAAFNFVNPNVQWNNSISSVPNPLQTDLYTVALHEFIHALGFASAINGNNGGVSKFGPSNNYYMRYDKFLTTNAGQPLLNSIVGSCSQQYGLAFSNTISPSVLGLPNCGSLSIDCGQSNLYNSLIVPNMPVHTPTCYFPGSSLSHFEDLCYPNFALPAGDDLYFVMSNALPSGIMKRYLKPEERGVLCDLGYSLVTTYSSNAIGAQFNYTNSCIPPLIWGRNDGIGNLGNFLFTPIGGVITCSINGPGSILSNDAPTAASITCLENVYPASGVANLNIPFNTITFNVTQGYTGVILLRYIPVDAFGNEGNISYIFMYAPDDSLNCGDINPCNLVGNGGFEFPNSAPCGVIGLNSAIDCWKFNTFSPDRFVRNCIGSFTNAPADLGNNTYNMNPIVDSYNGQTGNNHAVIGLGADLDPPPLLSSNADTKCESIWTNLSSPMIPGQVYDMSFWAYQKSGTFSDPGTIPNPPVTRTVNLNMIPMVLSFVGYTVGPINSGTLQLYPPPYAQEVLSPTLSPVFNSWQFCSYTFTYTGAYATNKFGVGIHGPRTYSLASQFLPPNSSYDEYVLIDEIKISPVTVSLNLPSPICPGVALNNLGQYLSQPVPGVFTGSNVTFSNGQYHFNSNLSLLSGAYTIAFTYTNNLGCEITTNDQVIISSNAPQEPTFAGTFSPSSVCIPNNSTTLNVNPAGTYTLLQPSGPPIQFTTSVAVNPGATSIYTIIGTNLNGCVSTNTSQIYVIPCACINAPGAEISGTFLGPLNTSPNIAYKIVANTNFVSGFPGAATTFSNNDIVVYPGVKITISGAGPGTTLSIVGSHFHGCGELWEGIEVTNSNCQLNIIPSQSRTSLIEDAHIAANILNIPAPWAPFYAQYYNPNILTVDNTIFNKNIYGIKIANIQINQNNYPYSIRRSLFTSRDIPYGINIWPNTNSVKNSLSANSSTLQTPWIDNVAYPPVPITSLLYNYNEFPEKGLMLENVGLTLDQGNSQYQFKGINIGMNGPANFNCFDNLHEDIYALNTNLKIVNSIFQSGRRYGPDPVSPNDLGGIGINAQSILIDRSPLITKHKIDISYGAGKGNFACSFYEKTICADIKDYFYTNIEYAKAYSYLNDYTYFSLINPFGSTGFNVRTNRYLAINLTKNNIYNIRNAMMIGLDNAVVFSNVFREVGSINVQDNSVDRASNSVGANPFVQIGLAINDPVAVTNNTIQAGSIVANVIGNNFRNVHNGVHVLNVSHTPVGIISNSISLVNEPPTPFFNPTPNQIGIFSAQSQKTTIIHTNVISGETNYGSGTEAISTALNASLSVRCNTTSFVAKGIEFNGMQTTDFFEDNHMANETYGFLLDNAATLSGTATTVGTITRPSNNVWQEPWVVPGGFKTATFGGSTAQQSRLFIQYSNSALNPANSAITDPIQNLVCPAPDSYSICALQPTTSSLFNATVSSNPTCRINNGGGNGGNNGGGNGGMNALLAQAVTNGIPYANNISQKQHIDKTSAYRTLNANPLLINGSPILSNFYSTAQTNYLQNMVNVELSLADNNLSLAQVQIAALTPTNTIETNYKNYYQVFKNKKDSLYNSGDSLVLIGIANMCPYTDGAVVFQARALYNIIYKGFYRYQDNCSSEPLAKTANTNPQIEEEKEINVVLKTTLFPNPNDGNFVLRINSSAFLGTEKQNVEIIIFDITGKEVIKENRILDDGEEIKMSNSLLNGTYLVKVKLKDGSTDIHRLLISK